MAFLRLLGKTKKTCRTCGAAQVSEARGLYPGREILRFAQNDKIGLRKNHDW